MRTGANFKSILIESIVNRRELWLMDDWLVAVLLSWFKIPDYKIAGFNAESAGPPTGFPINHF